jgi:putative flippase GtrA
MPLAVLYSFLALIATAANIGAQEIVTRVYHGLFAIEASVVVGTGIGLVVKYVLDKLFIFRFRTRDLLHDVRLFILYMSMGLATTLIFWIFEFGFEAVFATKELRYVGALIGLALGYWAKYNLDKRFVFRTSARS